MVIARYAVQQKSYLKKKQPTNQKPPPPKPTDQMKSKSKD